MKIKTFGPIDQRSFKQLERCMEAGDAELGVLCADHHPGYSQPIGGAIAYEGYVSPSGVGYDIGCVAAGEPVLCRDGCNLPIERVAAPVCADKGGMLRRVAPFLGVVERGKRAVLRVSLSNGRRVTVTGDHRIRTDIGWIRADELQAGDRVLCPVFLGLPREAGRVDPALLRIAGYVNGDGHLTSRANRVCLYTSKDHDAADLARDLKSVGCAPAIHRRVRPNGTIENAVCVNDQALRERLAELGCRTGKKGGRWRSAAEGVLRLPAWARANYLSAFASAEMSTARLVERRVVNLAIKQRGADAIEHVEIIMESLGFEVGISRSDGENWVAQVVGGEESQLRFMETVGFNRAIEKRIAATTVVAVAWGRSAHLGRRAHTQRLVRDRIASGELVRRAVSLVAADSGMSEAAVLHLAYRRGPLRRARDWHPTNVGLGECAYSAVVGLEAIGDRETYDVVTADPAEAFVAGGIAVHNCGNKAVQTDLTRKDLDALGGVERIMGEITKRISFGMGVPARERVDHPVLDKIRTAPFDPQRRLAGLAESQLGTVGSGNHYVNLMEDEQGRVWVGVHFGSRGFGHKTASGFLALAQGLAFDARAREGEMDSPPVLLEVGSELGDSYISAMQLAGEYAYAGRDTVVGKVLEILSAEPVHDVHNHHNYCIAGDQLVPTMEGPKRMDAIKEGDVVYAARPTGLTTTPVVAAWHSGSKPIYRFRIGNRTLRCSGSHPLLVKAGEALEWKAAESIALGDDVVCARAYYPEDESWGEETARFVGAFLGDGWIQHHGMKRQGYTVGIAIGTAGEAHGPRYRKLAETVAPNGGWGAGWGLDRPGHFGLSCSSRTVYETIERLGLAARSRDKRAPPEAFGLVRSEKLALLAGYFDADGSVAGTQTSNHGRGTIASVSEQLVRDLREIAIGCGLQVTPVQRTLRDTNYGPCTVFRCVLSTDATAQLSLWHEAKAANQRHTTMQRSEGRPITHGLFSQRVSTITVEDPEPTYDLEVADESHSFVVEGVVTHNCWREEHLGRSYWVIRKGCTPARPGQEGFVGGSMGDESVILEGVESIEAEESLFSTVHGAGRVMSRTQAAGRVRRRKRWACGNRDCDRTFESANRRCPEHPHARTHKVWVEEQLRPGRVDWPAVQARLRAQGIVLVGGGADEAPEVYKRLPDVLDAHAGSIRVKHTLRPLGVAMAARDVHDPYKD